MSSPLWKPSFSSIINIFISILIFSSFSSFNSLLTDILTTPSPISLTSCSQNNFPYRDTLILKKIPGRFLPILTSHNLEKQNTSVSNIIILIHGYRENITAAFCAGLSSLIQRNVNDHVAIISPYFYHEKMTGNEWMNKSNLTLESLYWRKNASWISGSDSSDVELSFTAHSSFDMLDDLYLIITQRNLFPSLKRVTFIGFSAGAQLLNRYSWATSLNTPLDPKFSDRVQIPIRFLISNPSSWLYFDNYRPSSSCILPYDTGPDHQCMNFTTITPSMKLKCKEVDEWRYGLSSIGNENQRDEYKYLQDLWTEKGLSEHIIWYFKKDVRYILGSYDACNCASDGYVNPSHCFISSLGTCPSNSKKSSTSPASSPNSTSSSSYFSCCQDTYPDSLNNDLSTTCGSQSQGLNRLQRGLNYISYLQFYLQKSAVLSSSSNSYPSIQYSIVPTLQHDMPTFLSSDIVYQWGYLMSAVSTPSPSFSSLVSHLSHVVWWSSSGGVLALMLGLVYYHHRQQKRLREYQQIPDLL